MILLDKSQREYTYTRIQAFASKSPISLKDGKGEISKALLQSSECIAAVLKLTGSSVSEIKAFSEYLIDEVLKSRTFIQDSNQIFVPLLCKPSNRYSQNPCFKTLYNFIGGDHFDISTWPSLEEHQLLNKRAFELLCEADIDIDFLRNNTSMVVPYPCRVPANGSSSTRAIPGVLLLPVNVPPIIYAECWFHECLHTELFRMEWFIGSELVRAVNDSLLPTPWRTELRPINLLFHGIYVFSNVILFMDKMKNYYLDIPSTWELSATKGVRLSMSDIDNCIEMRSLQIEQAIQIIEEHGQIEPQGIFILDRAKQILYNNQIKGDRNGRTT